MRYLDYLLIQEAYDIKRREYLPSFPVMCAAALSVHLLALLMWGMMPAHYLVQVPLHTLHVQFGEGGQIKKGAEAKAEKEKTFAARAEEATKKPAIQTATPKPEQPPRRTRPKALPAVTVNTPSAIKHNTIRPMTSPRSSAGTGEQNNAAPGYSFGTEKQSRQVMERYTRQISLQVQSQAKSVRLTEDLKHLARGKQIVVELLLVIGPDGMLQRYQVSRSSGFAELDQAAIGTAYRAAPFPPPPAEYSGYGFKVAVFVD